MFKSFVFSIIITITCSLIYGQSVTPLNGGEAIPKEASQNIKICRTSPKACYLVFLENDKLNIKFSETGEIFQQCTIPESLANIKIKAFETISLLNKCFIIFIGEQGSQSNLYLLQIKNQDIRIVNSANSHNDQIDTNVSQFQYTFFGTNLVIVYNCHGLLKSFAYNPFLKTSQYSDIFKNSPVLDFTGQILIKDKNQKYFGIIRSANGIYAYETGADLKFTNSLVTKASPEHWQLHSDLHGQIVLSYWNKGLNISYYTAHSWQNVVIDQIKENPSSLFLFASNFYILCPSKALGDQNLELSVILDLATGEIISSGQTIGFETKETPIIFPESPQFFKIITLASDGNAAISTVNGLDHRINTEIITLNKQNSIQNYHFLSQEQQGFNYSVVSNNYKELSVYHYSLKEKQSQSIFQHQSSENINIPFQNQNFIIYSDNHRNFMFFISSHKKFEIDNGQILAVNKIDSHRWSLLLNVNNETTAYLIEDK